MKNKKVFNYCEFCDTAIEDISPPNTSNYEDGMISISNGTILLSAKIIKAKSVHGVVESATETISGMYCNKTCLINHINKILLIEEK